MPQLVPKDQQSLTNKNDPTLNTSNIKFNFSLLFLLLLGLNGTFGVIYVYYYNLYVELYLFDK